MSAESISTAQGGFGPPLALQQLIAICWRERVTLLSTAAIVLFAGVLYVLLATPWYRATVTVAHAESVDSGGGLSSLAGQFGGLATLAGLNIGTNEHQREHLAYLQSDGLVRKFIEDRQLLTVLFRDQWDAGARRWRVSRPPTLNRAVALFKRRILSVREDRRTQIVEVSVLWQDPQVASSWANELIVRSNRDLQSRAIADGQGHLRYLREQIAKTEMVEIRAALNAVIAAELRSNMLANAQEQYAFKVIDPAVAPDKDDVARPQRIVIVAMALIAGAMLGIILALARAAWRTAPLQPTAER